MFKIGDVVVLKSGGPRMTVEKVDGTTVHCKWFEKDKQKQGAFDAAMLASGVRRAALAACRRWPNRPAWNSPRA